MVVINEFQTNPSIQLLLTTTGIGGHGFTLTAAQTVILVEHNMNPFVDMQAVDRCHRIGQKEKVTVYRLVSDEGNESRIMNLQRFKEYVASTVIATESANVSEGNGVLNELKMKKESPKNNEMIMKSLQEIESSPTIKSEKRVSIQEQEERKRVCTDSEDSNDGFQIFES